MTCNLKKLITNYVKITSLHFLIFVCDFFGQHCFQSHDKGFAIWTAFFETYLKGWFSFNLKFNSAGRRNSKFAIDFTFNVLYLPLDHLSSGRSSKYFQPVAFDKQPSNHFEFHDFILSTFYLNYLFYTSILICLFIVSFTHVHVKCST